MEHGSAGPVQGAPVYEIRVRGHLSPQLAAWFDDLTVTNQPQGEAVLAGVLSDQAALYGVLFKLNNLGLTLLAVTPLAVPPAGVPDGAP
ncbi:MAG TPA: hypothetical protein VF276_14670 [Chloroflexia bacterium]